MNRRKFLKSSLYSLSFTTFPQISFSQFNSDVVVIGAATDLYISSALD